LKLIFCLDPLRVSLTGIGRYTCELAKGLRDSGQLESLKFQFLLGWVDDPQILIQKYHSEEKVKGRANKPSWFKDSIYRTMRSGYRASSPTVKGLITFPYKDHIYHSPNYEIPHFAGHSVSTIHDLSVLRHPQYHPDIRVRYQRAIFPNLIQKGSLFITDSEFSKNELLDFYPAANGRVVSVPLGVDPMFCVREPMAIASTLAHYGLSPGNYSLSVGTIEPRKNIECLIEAYVQLPANLRLQYPLVLVGGAGWNSQHIHELIAKYSREGWLKYLRFVPDRDMAAIYSGARVFACVSHYEGFGLPVLEAMASGIPVISSDAASLPEVGGEAVVYVNPNQTEQITYAIKTVLEDDQYCQILSKKGLEQAKLFSWDRTTKETLLAYGRIA
jgi:glycosyltransferase involved in cell wall biosynthesis